MKDDHRKMITRYFDDGEKYSGNKKLAPLMIEAMLEHYNKKATGHHAQHYIPLVSEVSVLISQITTNRKKQQSSND